jgi:ligand-binding sensor domain-containing protein
VRVEEIGYLDFDLRIERAGAGHRALVVNSPAGQAVSEFALPFSDLELENFILRMSRPGRKTRRVGTPEFEAARSFGGRLFEALFAGEVRGCLRSSLDAAEREGRGLRIRLRLADAPELADVPWEYLYSPALNRFFALSNATPLVRYLDFPGRIAPLPVKPPLRLLAVIASPRDYPSLDADEEWKRLRSALSELEDAGLLALERLEPPTLSALQRRLRAGPCHILHFIGHGAFDDAAQDGLLVLEDEDGGGRIVSGQDLGVLLHDHHPMRLVVLNSCEGARTSRTDPFAGTAQSLVQQGMPAVLAMQFEISDAAAVVLSHEFYAALAAGYPVDASLAEARKAVFTNASGAEWGTPVLYLRSTDGRLFGLAPLPSPAPVAPSATTDVIVPAKDAPALAEAETVPAPSAQAPPTRKGRGRLALAVAGLVVVLAVVFGLSRVLPFLSRGERPEAPQSGAPAGAAAPNPAATPNTAANAATTVSIERVVGSQPTVLTNSAKVYDAVPAPDGIWAATSGGVVRWKSDGTSQLFNTSDGLPVNHQRDILPMQDGVLWSVGNNGAAQMIFDGDTLSGVEQHTPEDGVDIGESPVMARASDGSIWVASLYRNEPILRYDGSLWRPPDLNQDDPALSGVRPQIASMLQSKDGALWAGLHEDGILRLDGDAWTRFGPEQGVPQDTVWQLVEGNDGEMWAAAGESGLLRLDAGSEQWERVEFQQADAAIYWISQLADGSLWASGNNFILRSEDGGQRWRTVASAADGLDQPRAVVEDEAGQVWVATDNGVARYEDGQWRRLVRPGEVSSYALGRIYLAPDGKLWVLPQYGGAPSIIDPQTGEVGPPRGWTPEAPDIVALAFDDGAVWAGHNEGLLRVTEREIERWDATDGLPGGRVNALLLASDTLWIGGSEGLAALDAQTGQITGQVESLQGQVVDALALGPDGAVWAGTHWGKDGASAAVYRIAGDDIESWPTGAAPLEREGAWVNAIAAAEDGGVWVASDTGVYRWDGEGWQSWDSAQGAPAGEVFALLPHSGAMWMAGDGGSLDRWDAESGWQRFEPEGLLSDALALQVSGDGSFWIATQDGLLRYGPE